MKDFKIIAFALAFLSAVVSCEKMDQQVLDENDKQEEIVPNAGNSSTLGNVMFPETISGTISPDTKTAYDADGTFSWSDSDRVRLLVSESLDTYTKIGVYTYKILDGNLSGDKKTAVFTNTSSGEELAAFKDGDWKSTGIAVYPASALERFASPESHSYGSPWFTHARNGSVSGEASDIILFGVADDLGTNFKFSTAMAVLKITLRNIPANAAKVKLSTSDKTNYPLSGDFALSIVEGKVEMSFLDSWVSSFADYQAVDISSDGAIDERDFYFNIPAASYPANTLSLTIEDANGGQILKRKIAAKLNIARNECLSVPALSYSHSVGFEGGSVTEPRIAWTIDSKRVRFCVSTSETIDISSFMSGYTFQNQKESGSYSDGYKILSYGDQKPTTSGKYYMHYIIQSDANGLPTSLTDANVIAYGTIPFYFSSGDVADYVGEYTFTSTNGGTTVVENPASGTLQHPGTGSNYSANMIIAATDDYTKGNLMLTTMYGKACASGKQLYGYLDASTGIVVFPYSGDDHYFHYANGNYFQLASSASISFSSGDYISSEMNGDLVFTGSSSSLVHGDYLVMDYTGSYPVTSWRAFIYGKGLTFTK